MRLSSHPGGKRVGGGDIVAAGAGVGVARVDPDEETGGATALGGGGAGDRVAGGVGREGGGGL